MQQGGDPHRKDLFTAEVRPGAHIRDIQGKAVQEVEGGFVRIEAETPTVTLGKRTLVYTWGHGTHSGGASGYVSLPHDFKDPGKVKAKLAQHQNRDHVAHEHHAPKHVAVFDVTPIAMPDNLYLDRPSTPGMREKIRTFAPGSRLDLCHNVPNQPGGGAVIAPLVPPMKFFQTERKSVSVPMYRQDSATTPGPMAGYSHWIRGFIKVGTDHQIIEGWVLLRADHAGDQLTRLPPAR